MAVNLSLSGRITGDQIRGKQGIGSDQMTFGLEYGPRIYRGVLLRELARLYYVVVYGEPIYFIYDGGPEIPHPIILDEQLLGCR